MRGKIDCESSEAEPPREHFVRAHDVGPIGNVILIVRCEEDFAFFDRRGKPVECGNRIRADRWPSHRSGR